MPICLSLPHLKKDRKAEQVEDGEEKITANVVDSIILANELSSAQEGNESKELGVRLRKRPIESNTFSIIIPDVLQWGMNPIPRAVQLRQVFIVMERENSDQAPFLKEKIDCEVETVDHERVRRRRSSTKIYF